MHVPAELVPLLREGLENGRKLEALLTETGPLLLRRFREDPLVTGYPGAFDAVGTVEQLTYLRDEVLPAEWLAELFEAARSGDPRARAAVDETARLIGIAVANVAAVVDPSLIVLGGALFAQAEPLVREVRSVVHRIAHAPIDVVVSALGKEAPLWGGLLVATTEARGRLRHRVRETRVAAAE